VQRLGWTKVAANIRDEDAESAYILTLVENLQREDLSPHEEAEALGLLIRERKWSVRKVAEAIKRDPLYVSRRLRVFEDPILRKPVLEQRLAVSTAEVLLRAEPAQRASWVKETLSNGWGQNDVRRALWNSNTSVKCGVTPHPDRSGYVLDLVNQLRTVLAAGTADLSPVARDALKQIHRELGVAARR